jgi:uncharacterized protein (TIGR00369 family)
MGEQYNELAPRTAPEIHVTDIVLPNQTNNFNTMFGGEVMALMDKAAAIAGLRFCRQPLVTASSERIDFRTPIHAGEIIEAIARVIYVGRTSMIVRVHIYAEHPLKGDTRVCTTGYFRMKTRQLIKFLTCECTDAHRVSFARPLMPAFL